MFCQLFIEYPVHIVEQRAGEHLSYCVDPVAGAVHTTESGERSRGSGVSPLVRKLFSKGPTFFTSHINAMWTSSGSLLVDLSGDPRLLYTPESPGTSMRNHLPTHKHPYLCFQYQPLCLNVDAHAPHAAEQWSLVLMKSWPLPACPHPTPPQRERKPGRKCSNPLEGSCKLLWEVWHPSQHRSLSFESIKFYVGLSVL